MEHVIRTVRADEWHRARDIRLAALQDPAAPLAFLDTYEAAVARPDAHWRERTAGAAEGSDDARQFVAEAPDGSWEGTVTVLVERPGGEVRFGEAPEADQTHVVGVYVRPEARGSGVAEALFREAVEWSWSLGGAPVRRVRLYVHERNERAAAFYRKAGFVPTGAVVPLDGDADGALEVEYEVRRPVTV
ncbi:GNAT family N-acetyltransferase [Streptomyces ficellus]|uniref:GNAT family N-acetyltransferase n=1 Tax=Streptomyces ficellus TaxID=1977088 RepID=A0A6I6F7X4_9ACTN|nr:GNAT family N-acetyltransferase [Streptomyces ficellus]QGV79810.1 GNAT family N-acetyltransferase [Streptomyces ficellus]